MQFTPRYFRLILKISRNHAKIVDILINWRWFLNTLEIARQLVDTLDEKKGEDIVLIDIHEVASFTDYFIICSGTSDRMLDSLANAVIEKAHESAEVNKRRAEGQASSGWLLVDLDDIIVHLFSPDQREYYQLEQLWERGKVLLRMQ